MSQGTVRELWEYRELLGLLVRRELKVRYKDSALGFVWTLLRPLTLLVVYYVAIGKFLGAERSIPNFGIFVFAGLTAWMLFTEIVSGATASVVANQGLVKKVYLPREVFPLSVVGASLVNFGVQLGILVVAVLVLRQPPSLMPLLVHFPLAVVAVVLLASAVGFAAAAANVFLRDVQYLVEIVLMVMFWASPIVYSWAFVRDAIGQGTTLDQLYLANPMTVAVLGFQSAFWSSAPAGSFPHDLTLRLLVVIVISTVLLWLGHRLFTRLEGNFAQEL